MGVRGLAKRLVAQAVAPGLAGLGARILKLEEARGHAGTAPPPIWRGSLADGCAIRWNGTVDERATVRLREDLRRRIEAVRAEGRLGAAAGAAEAARLVAELNALVGAASDEELRGWCERRTVVEIGSGPRTRIAGRAWLRAILVDPLADGFASEGLLAGDGRGLAVVVLGASPEWLPLASASADLVCWTIEPGRAVLAGMMEVRRVLRPGGLLWVLPGEPALAEGRSESLANSIRESAAECGFDPLSAPGAFAKAVGDSRPVRGVERSWAWGR